MRQTDTTTHKAIKQHRCDWCLQLIEPGETYKRYRFFDGSEASTIKMHAECFDAMQDEAREWGGYFEWWPRQEERPKKQENKTPAFTDEQIQKARSEAAVLSKELQAMDSKEPFTARKR